MSVQGDAAATAFIERICDAHREPDPGGPLVTMVDGVWAYCAGHRDADHEWRTIGPTTRRQLESESR